MRRAPAALAAIAAAALAGALASCGDEGDGASEDVTAFCTEATEAIDGLATIEVLAPGARKPELENAQGTIEAELGDVTPPSGTPEADALGPAIDDVLALTPEALGSSAGQETLRTTREAFEAFEAAEC